MYEAQIKGGQVGDFYVRDWEDAVLRVLNHEGNRRSDAEIISRSEQRIHDLTGFVAQHQTMMRPENAERARRWARLVEDARTSGVLPPADHQEERAAAARRCMLSFDEPAAIQACFRERVDGE